MAEPKKKHTWIWVVVGILAVLFVMAVVLVGSAIFYVRHHISAEVVTTAVGTEEFEHERARFAGQQPLIEMREHDQPLIHRRTAASAVPLTALHVFAFDARSGKLVHVDIPFWLIRRMPGKRFNLGSGQGLDFDTDRMRLTVDDLEQAGPGLLIDGTNPRDGAKVLVWTE